MSRKFAVILGAETLLPERDLWVSQAWGDVPVSFIQDDEVLNGCSFLDIKVNKWEVNPLWSSRQEVEPWIRIEIFKSGQLEQFLQTETFPVSVDAACETLMLFELDEGGSELDFLMLRRLVSVFFGRGKVYESCGGFREVSERDFVFLPSKPNIHEQLLKQ